VALDAEAVTGVDDITRLLDERRIGRQIAISVVRNATIVRIELVPEERSEAQ
jgi:hypothetical protein